MDIVESRAGLIALQVTGAGAKAAFRNERGCHRVQQVPPTERSGRVHSSTITIAVLDVPENFTFKLDDRDLEWSMCRGSGAGGQNRNVTNSAVQLKHVPTGLMVRSENQRSQQQNKRMALVVLSARLLEQAAIQTAEVQHEARRGQVGEGTRNERRRTVAYQRDEVVDHETGKRIRISDYVAGKLDNLY